MTIVMSMSETHNANATNAPSRGAIRKLPLALLADATAHDRTVARKRKARPTVHSMPAGDFVMLAAELLSVDHPDYGSEPLQIEAGESLLTGESIVIDWRGL